MKATHISSDRHYRQYDVIRPDEQKLQVVVEESDLWITLPKAVPVALARDTALAALRTLRGEIQAWVQVWPAFRHSLVPLTPQAIPAPFAPLIVRRMDKASRLIGVGPFAAVAGAVAQGVAEHLLTMLQQGAFSPELIVENGGDTYLYSCRERVVALLADPSAPEHIGLRFTAQDFPLSLCASSGTIGHSLSFGRGELALVLAKDAALADAAATAYGNMLKSSHSVDHVLRQVEKDASFGIEGLFVQCQGRLGLWGKLELTALA